MPFFVLSLKAGGSGLNLTAASHVVHFDRWWNPAVENQATDRAFRIGQKRNVLVHKFVCRGTVEEKIDALIESKTGPVGGVAGRRRRDQPDGDEGRRAAAAGRARSECRDEGLKADGSRYHGGWAPYVPVAERRRKAAREMAKLRKKGHPVSPVIIEGRTIATHLLGQGVVRQPGELPRLREPPAARPHLCAQRLGGRSADRALADQGDGQRLVDLHGHGQHRGGAEAAVAVHLQRIAPAGSIRWSSCCRGGFPRA